MKPPPIVATVGGGGVASLTDEIVQVVQLMDGFQRLRFAYDRVVR